MSKNSERTCDDGNDETLFKAKVPRTIGIKDLLYVGTFLVGFALSHNNLSNAVENLKEKYDKFNDVPKALSSIDNRLSIIEFRLDNAVISQPKAGRTTPVSIGNNGGTRNE